VTKAYGKLFLITPNNSYYKSYINYNELKLALSSSFSKFQLFFFNTYPKISEKNRKLNLTNIIPKVSSKFITKQKQLELMLKIDKGSSKSSVSFYVEAIKNQPRKF